MQLTKENDKMEMIDIAINPINEFIKSFFNELEKSMNTINDSDIGKNALNINGSWGSGKSTIVNNLEYYYQYKNDIEKPKFLIINLWEYETSSNPYYDLMEYIFYNICPDLFTEEENENDKNLKQYLFNFLKKIAPNKFLLTFTDHTSNVSYSAAAEWTKNNKIENINLSMNINNFIYELKNKIIDSKEKYVIIFDEIDRCTVDNQIIFLSYIKNIFFKITNIFFIVSSNNEVINKKLYIDSKEKYESKYELENYTDKLFNNVFDLDIHFDPENLTFIANDYIKQFLKEMNIKNPRLIKKIIENIESIILKMKNNDIKNNSKQIINKIELIIFYIYYLKFCKEKEYKNIFKFSNEIKIINTDFFKIVKKFIFEKLEKNKSSLSNKNIFIWIFTRNKFNLDIDIPISFNFIKLQKPINGLELNCSCFTFQFLIPFFWSSINMSNINNIFNKNLMIENIKNGFYFDKRYEVGLELKDLILEKNQDVFLNILTTNFYENNKNLICDCFNSKKVNLVYENFQQIIQWTVFNSSWNENLNINKELQEENKNLENIYT